MSLQKIKQLFLPVLLCVLNLFLFGPFQVYSGNVDEFAYGFGQIVSLYWAPFLIIFLLLMIPGLFLSGKKMPYYTSIIFALCLLFWAQGNLLIRDYGVFDARGIDWGRHAWFGYFDIGIWLATIFVFTLLREKIIKQVAFVCVLLLLVQGSITIYSMGNAHDRTRIKNTSTSPGDQTTIYVYSKKFNIIHVILDAFQTDVFSELLKEDPELKKEFDGFVLFKENMAVAPFTSFAIPAIFSGKEYNGEESPKEYFERSIAEEGFQNVLFEKGFDINLMPMLNMPGANYTNYYCIPNSFSASEATRQYLAAARLLDTTFFRFSPHYLKKWFYNDNNWRIRPLVSFFTRASDARSFSDKAFLKDYTERIEAQKEAPAYHFMHLNPPHPPYVTDENGNYAGKVLPSTRQNYKNEAKYILRSVTSLFQKLKDIDVYNSSLIIIQGDHGSEFPSTDLQMDPSPADGMVDLETIPRIPALLVVKKPYSHGDINTSISQTMVSDVAATILEIAGISGDYGESIFDLNPNADRERLLTIYQGGSNGSLVRYLVTGSIYDPGAWEKRVVDASYNDTLPLYEYGASLTFGSMGNATIYEERGWSSPLEGHDWNNGKMASLVIPLQKTESDLLLKAKFVPFISKNVVDRQRIVISVNGEEVGGWVAGEGKQKRSVIIPKKLVLEGKNRISFYLPDAISPVEHNIGGDARVLAMAMAEMSIDTISVAKKKSLEMMGTGSEGVAVEGTGVWWKRIKVVDFGEGGNSEFYKGSGWSDTGKNSSWTNGYRASLNFGSLPLSSDATMKLTVLPFLVPGKVEKQRVHIMVNGQSVGELVLDDNGFQEHTIGIEKEVANGENFTVQFELPDAACPQELGVSEDNRRLGLCVKSLQIVENG